MLDIKKYANGRFFDTAAKKFIKPEKLAEMIKKGEKIKVTLTQTGKDITDKVIAQFTKKEKTKKQNKKEMPFLKTEKFKQWLGEALDSKVEQVMDIIKLPSRDQVVKLNQNIKELNDKIDVLKLSQEKSAKKKSAAKPAAPKPAVTKKATATKKKTVAKKSKPAQTKSNAVKTEEKK